MKNLILTLLAVTIITSHSSSQDCKYKIQKVDKFTGQTELELEPVLLLDKYKNETIKLGNITMTLKRIGDNRFFVLGYSIKASEWNGKGKPYFRWNESKLICVLEDGNKVELPIVSKPADVIDIKVFISFSISDEAFTMLRKSNITDMRAAASMNPFDIIVKEDANTKDYFHCIK